MTAPMSSSPPASGSSPGGDISTSWQALSQIPQILTDVRVGVYGLKALISTPAAATSTGSPAASAAIVALGAEIAIFLARTVEAIADDIGAMGDVIENYQRIDGEVAGQCTAGMGALAAGSRAISPNTGLASPGVGGASTSPIGATPGFNPDAGSSWGQQSHDPGGVDVLRQHADSVSDFGDFVDDVVNDVTDLVDDVVDGVGDAVGDFTDGIDDGISDAADWIRGDQTNGVRP